MHLFIGKIKAHFDRQRAYLAIINFAILVYLFVDKRGWSYWYLVAIPIICLLVYFDAKYIMPDEFEYLHLKSPVLKEILEKSLREKGG